MVLKAVNYILPIWQKFQVRKIVSAEKFKLFDKNIRWNLTISHKTWKQSENTDQIWTHSPLPPGPRLLIRPSTQPTANKADENILAMVKRSPLAPPISGPKTRAMMTIYHYIKAKTVPNFSHNFMYYLDGM